MTTNPLRPRLAAFPKCFLHDLMGEYMSVFEWIELAAHVTNTRTAVIDTFSFPNGLLLNVGGAKHTKASLASLMTEAGLRIKDVRPVNPYLHAFDSTV